jgi:diacylglycerol kinase family enzyme
METFQARQVQISSDTEHPRELDGDLIGPSRTLTATVRPAALWMCVPEKPSAGTQAIANDAPALTMPLAR